MSAEESSNPNLHKKNIDILWVANIRQAKRPGILLELASTLPEYNFTIIGGPVPGVTKHILIMLEKELMKYPI